VPWFGRRWNFEKKPHEMTLQEIPKDTDVLITHTPPHGILDGAKRYGCELLRKTFDDGELQPIYHFFGHIHEDGGKCLN